MESARPKKSRTLVIRMEEDIYLFLQQESLDRRVTISQVVRDMVYIQMQKKGERQ